MKHNDNGDICLLNYCQYESICTISSINKEGEGGEEGDDVASILALGGKKCKPKEEMGGADALAEMVGETCDMDGMDEKVWIHLISQSMLKLRILWELKKISSLA